LENRTWDRAPDGDAIGDDIVSQSSSLGREAHITHQLHLHVCRERQVESPLYVDVLDELIHNATSRRGDKVDVTAFGESVSSDLAERLFAIADDVRVKLDVILLPNSAIGEDRKIKACLSINVCYGLSFCGQAPE
jgi:hypothetical protein